VSQKVPTSDLVTNDLIDDINSFDAGKIEAVAKDGADYAQADLASSWPCSRFSPFFNRGRFCK